MPYNTTQSHQPVEIIIWRFICEYNFSHIVKAAFFVLLIGEAIMMLLNGNIAHVNGP